MEKKSTKRYHVEVKRLSPTRAVAEAHGHSIEIAAKGGDPSLGFTGPELLLTAFGDCIISNVNRVAAEMGLQIDAAEVVLDGARPADGPARIEPLRYRLIVQSQEPEEKLKELCRRATSEGPATHVILHGISPKAEVEIIRE